MNVNTIVAADAVRDGLEEFVEGGYAAAAGPLSAQERTYLEVGLAALDAVDVAALADDDGNVHVIIGGTPGEDFTLYVGRS